MNLHPVNANQSHQILLISPYHGGSHRAWAEGYQRYSKNQVTLLTMPARFWKWRMHGGSVTLARRYLETNCTPSLIFATDMLDLTTFLALTRLKSSSIPVILYMHENQLTYPLPTDGRTGPMRRQLGERDQHYAFINYASMLAADLVLFNSDYHRTAFFSQLPGFLKHFPEYNEFGSIHALKRKSRVLPVGVDFNQLDFTPELAAGEMEPPLILWNQRWEFDKNPEMFFRVLFRVANAGIPFRLAVCGQQFGKRPSIFDEAAQKLNHQIIHFGQANPATYRKLLWQAAITISTAHHEFFGISILEAIYCQTTPLLPNRLSYPELIPTNFHTDCLYENEADLYLRLCRILVNPGERKQGTVNLARAISRYNWPQIAPLYDSLVKDQISRI